jgi:hypothetical protein
MKTASTAAMGKQRGAGSIAETDALGRFEPRIFTARLPRALDFVDDCRPPDGVFAAA